MNYFFQRSAIAKKAAEAQGDGAEGDVALNPGPWVARRWPQTWPQTPRHWPQSGNIGRNAKWRKCR